MEVRSNVHVIFPEGELVKKVSLEEIRPCIVVDNMIRVLFQLDSEIKSVIPILVNKHPLERLIFLNPRIF